jgi:flavodoxin
MSNTLILYYSYEGSTKRIAEYIAANLDTDIERVVPIKEMKSKGFGKYLWGGSQVLMKKQPEIKPISVDLKQYNKVIIGSPIWAGTFAPPIYTLFEQGLLKDKEIGYFYCHQGGAKKAADKAKEIIENNNTLLSSFSCVNVDDNFENIKSDVLNWASKLL